MFSTLGAGSRRVEILLSPLFARLPRVIEDKMFLHDMSGFVNLATHLTRPGIDVSQV